MNYKLKHILLYIIFFALVLTFFRIIDTWYQKNLDLQNNLLIQEAKTLYQDQITMRKWNAQYGGVFVKPHPGEKPNPYLKDNILKIDDNLTLMKINPAFMTRQLSELSHNNRYKFRITGLKPINPNNQPKAFEKRALEYFNETGKKEYYEFNDDGTFNYMGALITIQACLTCHKEQGYSVGDIKGGISIELNAKKHTSILASLKTKANFAKVFIFIFLAIITLLIGKQLQNNITLLDEVKKRTLEIESTKDLMQKILDANTNFMFLLDNNNVIFTNKTVLDYANCSSLEEFNQRFGDIASKFEPVDDEEFLQPTYKDKTWVEYLYKNQQNINFKVLIIYEGRKVYFRPYAKKLLIKEKLLHLISFDIITDEYEEIQALEEKASLDHLTNLLNRGKFDEILSQEIHISNKTHSHLSIIFLDIDYFKKINDTLGHDIGDSVLVELASLLKNNIRKVDHVGRWGGEEFIIALQSTNKHEASRLGETLRKNVQNHSFSKAGEITISLGITQYIHQETKESFLKRADEALYEAKESGRNKVVVK